MRPYLFSNDELSTNGEWQKKPKCGLEAKMWGINDFFV